MSDAPPIWPLKPNFLDALVRDLSSITPCQSLKLYRAVQLSGDGLLSAFGSAHARAYQVQQENGELACLRFWTDTPQVSVLQTYSLLENSPKIYRECGLTKVQLIPEALVVSEKSIPAVLMDWVRGKALADAIEEALNDPRILSRIAEALRSTFSSLNRQGISHGDLRASNITITFRNEQPIVGFVDFDSIRWRGGAESERVFGGNQVWEKIIPKPCPTVLQSDLMDQAHIYLTLLVLSKDRSLWESPTDHFLTQNCQFKMILSRAKEMAGRPAEVAKIVNRVVSGEGSWEDLGLIFQKEHGPALTEDMFWDVLISERADKVKSNSTGGTQAPIDNSSSHAIKHPSAPSSVPGGADVPIIGPTGSHSLPSKRRANSWRRALGLFIFIGIIYLGWTFRDDIRILLQIVFERVF